LLASRGHEVITLERQNSDIRGLTAHIRAAVDGIYSVPAKKKMAELLRRERPDIVHLHNVYPQLSPSVVQACNEADVPVVMSLHDYKLICPTAQYFRDGSPCHLCSNGREYHCLLTNCRGSWPESAAYAARTVVARRAGWFTKGVERFIACSEFVREQYVKEGFPAERMVVIANFADMPARNPAPNVGTYAAFLGRISPEKGVGLLLEAARLTSIPVRVAGTSATAAQIFEPSPTVTFVGQLGRADVGPFLNGARYLVVPTLCEEPFGIVAAEAMGHGLPVIAARTGGLTDVVDDGVNGLHFEPGDVGALAECMTRLWNDPHLARSLGAAGRAKAIREYHKEVYCTRLERLYESVAARKPRYAGATL
jgi:glycosyltransferase involved in cell wall biosynthesis